MPHAKIPRKSTNIDMTAMCDVAFLLLTFFMLATKFKPEEPVVVKTPSSISSIPLPDKDIMLLTVDAKGRIFFAIDNKLKRKALIEDIDAARQLKLSEAEKKSFALGASVGVPLSQIKQYLSSTPEQQKAMDLVTPGIPVDSVIHVPTNELDSWIESARNTNPMLRICIKADGDASYPNVSKIIKTLEAGKIFKFNLITNLKSIPAGTAAYAEANAPRADGDK
ncbi:biopolymer transporter ExbD [Flavipsychrobacter stenotrophus]|uniref:Biopolymer transporter ExbD n=1 Tax=Flavipsychrobacter stenotrophus TaxID=2077091 RepID=A0A2S7T1J6_9BACT|nr:biopolymer transporter ExbD [Flavipsychrobacter stenotrophus]PQJ12675.1 biopolymer transporter ExbD [Flavipsychrobacter stenotrophus]